MTKLVTLMIDGQQVEVPEGTLVVDAAMKIGVDIPVFCYHPKMEPVGMCRMCLVEIGRPMVDRATGQPVLEEDGSPKLQFGPKLETACTTPVSQGMVVLGLAEKAKAGRQHILEFLLTSHPLDCPVCDKGGECPLQNLTIGFGPSESRYLYDEKVHKDKHVALGELIFLDRERCIQCARCVRFQSDIASDPVIGFFNRGRALEIVTYSEPGFDSYWSGNTTDICPVGALTTADFRFRARPWELRSAASICTHCPVGCNVTLNLRREAASNGGWVVKRVLPRQNEAVNEIWICDKGRFGHHFAAQAGNQRLLQPMIRRDGKLQPATWDEALKLVAEHFKETGESLFTLAGGRLSNEDFYYLQKLSRALGGQAALYTNIGGGELTSHFGFSPGTNFVDMGSDSVILVVGSDLEEEAPVYWLRVKQAVKRGAKLIVLNMRRSKLDGDADHVLHYPFGSAVAAVMAMLDAVLGSSSASTKRPDLPETIREFARSQSLKAAVKDFSEAKDAVILYGSDGMGLSETAALAQACSHLLIATGHVGRPNNGLLGVWQRANDQGAWEMGWQPIANLATSLEDARALYIVAADPVGDNPASQTIFGGDKFVVTQELFMTATAQLSDVVLPAQAWTEREGSYTSAERRVQRYYPALQPTTALPQQIESPGTSRSPLLTAVRPSREGPLADFLIPSLIAGYLDIKDLTASSAAAAFAQLSSEIPVFSGLNYQKLAEVHEQWPVIGRGDLFYGGSAYQNTQGLGVQLPLAEADEVAWPPLVDFEMPKLGMMAFPVTRLYDKGTTLLPSKLLHQRIGDPYVVLNSQDAARLKISDGDMVRLALLDTDIALVVRACLEEALPERIVLVPRGIGIPIYKPTPVQVKRET